MNRIKYILKNNKFFYKIYYYICSGLLKIISIFIKVDPSVILINSFGGKKFDDSPRVIFEYMTKKLEYKEYKIYWALDDCDKYQIDNAIKIKNNSLQYFYIALKAKYWITNSAIERGLKFKNKKTIYINTWHGSTIKKMGKDIDDKSFKFNTSPYDYMFAQSHYDIEIFSRVFNIPKEKLALVGLPRNDELTRVKNNEIKEIREKLKIPENKKVILYAPTFREYNKDKNGCFIAPPLNIEMWKRILSKEYVLIFRAHYEVYKSLGIKEDEFLYNMSDYKNLNELLKISDILISDYSSIMFDYSILERPIYSYAYDYEEYLQKRGLYLDLEEELPNAYVKNQEELLEKIKNCDFVEQKKKTRKFKEKYVEKCGQATKFIDKIILGG